MKTTQLAPLPKSNVKPNLENTGFRITAKASFCDLSRKEAWEIDGKISGRQVLSGVDHILQRTGFVDSWSVKNNINRNDQRIKILSRTNMHIEFIVNVDEDPAYMSQIASTLETFFAKTFMDIDSSALIEPLMIDLI